MSAIFWLSIHQLTGRWRISLILLLAALPVGLSVIVHFAAKGDASFNRDFTNILLDGMLIAGILPLVTMALATSAFGNELEDKTLGFLSLMPVARWRIVLCGGGRFPGHPGETRRTGLQGAGGDRFIP